MPSYIARSLWLVMACISCDVYRISSSSSRNSISSLVLSCLAPIGGSFAFNACLVDDAVVVVVVSSLGFSFSGCCCCCWSFCWSSSKRVESSETRSCDEKDRGNDDDDDGNNNERRLVETSENVAGTQQDHRASDQQPSRILETHTHAHTHLTIH